MWNTPAYKENKVLSTLGLAATRAVETDSLKRHWLQTASITELETLWDFNHMHVGYFKSRMLTSEIHLTSLYVHVSKLNSEMNIKLYSEIQKYNCNLKLAAPLE